MGGRMKREGSYLDLFSLYYNAEDHAVSISYLPTRRPQSRQAVVSLQERTGSVPAEPFAVYFCVEESEKLSGKNQLVFKI